MENGTIRSNQNCKLYFVIDTYLQYQSLYSIKNSGCYGIGMSRRERRIL